MKRNILRIIGCAIPALVALAIFIGCAGAGIKGANEINAEELKVKIENQEEFILLDVREPYEFDEGSIDFAFNLPRGRIESDIGNQRYWDEQAWDMPEKDAEIIIYSKKGKLGNLATETLIKMGYTNVKNLYGGYTLWLDPDADLDAEEPVSGGCGG